MTAIGVLGSRGFVGSEVCRLLSESGIEHVALDRLWLPEIVSSTDLTQVLESHESSLIGENQELLAELSKVDGVVNAAGLAAPTETNWEPLWRTNILLPAVFDMLCDHAEVSHIVHVSSAAVQSHLNPLNEQERWVGHSLYAQSKIEAEQYLLHRSKVPTAIYRATSVVGPNRKIIDSLVRLYGGRIAPVFGDGLAPLPLSALPNTAAAIVALSMARADGVFLQPPEGATQASVAAALSGSQTKLIKIPAPKPLGALVSRLGSKAGPLSPYLRRVELLVFGQAQEANRLEEQGYAPVVDIGEYLRSLTQHS